MIINQAQGSSFDFSLVVYFYDKNGYCSQGLWAPKVHKLAASSAAFRHTLPHSPSLPQIKGKGKETSFEVLVSLKICEVNGGCWIGLDWTRIIL